MEEENWVHTDVVDELLKNFKASTMSDSKFWLNLPERYYMKVEI